MKDVYAATCKTMIENKGACHGISCRDCPALCGGLFGPGRTTDPNGDITLRAIAWLTENGEASAQGEETVGLISQAYVDIAKKIIETRAKCHPDWCLYCVNFCIDHRDPINTRRFSDPEIALNAHTWLETLGQSKDYREAPKAKETPKTQPKPIQSTRMVVGDDATYPDKVQIIIDNFQIISLELAEAQQLVEAVTAKITECENRIRS